MSCVILIFVSEHSIHVPGVGRAILHEHSRPVVPNLEYIFPWGYICLSEGVHLSMILHDLFPDICACFDRHSHCALGSVLERATRCSPSTSFKQGSFMVSNKDEKLCSHKYVVHNWRKISISTFKIRFYTSSIQIQNWSSGASLNFYRRVLFFVLQFKNVFSNSCIDISALAEKGFRIQPYCSILIVKK